MKTRKYYKHNRKYTKRRKKTRIKKKRKTKKRYNFKGYVYLKKKQKTGKGRPVVRGGGELEEEESDIAINERELEGYKHDANSPKEIELKNIKKSIFWELLDKSSSKLNKLILKNEVLKHNEDLREKYLQYTRDISRTGDKKDKLNNMKRLISKINYSGSDIDKLSSDFKIIKS